MNLKAVGIAIGILFVLIVVYFNNPLSILSYLYKTNLVLFLGAVGVELVILSLIGMKLRILTKKPFSTSFYITVIGIATNLLTPFMKIGGEPLKVYMLKRRNIKTTQASAVISIDTMTELIVLYVLVVVLGFLTYYVGIFPAVFFSIVLIAAVIGILIMASSFMVILRYAFLKKIVNVIIRFISKFRPVKPGKHDYARAFINYFKLIFSDKKVAYIAAISLLTKILEFFRMWLIFFSLGFFLPLELVIALWVFMMVLAMIPWLPGGLGLIEAGGITFLAGAGLSTGMAGAGILLERFVSYWIVLIVAGMFIYLRKRGVKFS